eukprot:4237544-Amphidinium_carterae.1
MHRKGRLYTPTGISELFDIHHGVAQGDPCSPLLFVLLLDWVLGPVIRNWQMIGLGFKFFTSLINHIMFMDDMLVIGSSMAQVLLLVRDVEHALSKIGLNLNPDKLNWIATDNIPDTEFPLGDCRVSRSSELLFLGVPLRLHRPQDVTIRRGAAFAVYHSWRPLLRLPGHVPERLQLLRSTSSSALLWGSASLRLGPW